MFDVWLRLDSGAVCLWFDLCVLICFAVGFGMVYVGEFWFKADCGFSLALWVALG